MIKKKERQEIINLVAQKYKKKPDEIIVKEEDYTENIEDRISNVVFYVNDIPRILIGERLYDYKDGKIEEIRVEKNEINGEYNKTIKFDVFNSEKPLIYYIKKNPNSFIVVELRDFEGRESEITIFFLTKGRK